MDKAAQDWGENSEDEEAERASEDVEDEAVFCAFTALLERHWCKKSAQASQEQD